MLVMALKFTKASLLSEMNSLACVIQVQTVGRLAGECGLLTFYSRGKLCFRDLCKN